MAPVPKASVLFSASTEIAKDILPPPSVLAEMVRIAPVEP